MSDKVYGRNAVSELLKSKADSVTKIYFQFNTDDKRLTEILLFAKRNRIAIGKASHPKLAELCGSEKHQGVVAVVGENKFYELEDILEEEQSKPFFFVILDSIEDPQNLGAIIRSAEAAGASAILIPRDHSAPVNATVHKTSAGAVSHARICMIGNVSQTIEKLKQHQVWVVGTDLRATKNYTDFDYTMNIAIVIGSEGKGMRQLVRERCDELVKIPIVGKTESLNASVSAGIMIYEVVRQRSVKSRS